jgi:fatty acid desaturase
MNCLRTLASHRWISEGRQSTFVEQMLDSVTLDNDSLVAVLFNPVGLRYHATHHLFPSMPYHNIRAAHMRLMDELPLDSPYRQTVVRSMWKVFGDLWRTAATRHLGQLDSPPLSADSQATVREVASKPTGPRLSG